MSAVVLALVIFILSMAGGLAPRFLNDRLSGRFDNDALTNLTGVASGLLLASALLVVIPEGFHVATESAGDDAFVYEPVILGATVLAGFVAMLLLEGFGVGHAVHEEHHDHADGHGHGHVHHPTSSGVLAIGLTVHALADGLAIGAAIVAGEVGFSVLVALAVLLHRVPAAFSLGVFALHETDDGGRAVRGILAFSLATPLLMMLSALVLDAASDKLVALALLFSAGTFMYVATVDTLPAIHNPETGRRSVMNVVIGVAIFAAVFLVTEATGLLDHGH